MSLEAIQRSELPSHPPFKAANEISVANHAVAMPVRSAAIQTSKPGKLEVTNRQPDTVPTSSPNLISKQSNSQYTFGTSRVVKGVVPDTNRAAARTVVTGSHNAPIQVSDGTRDDSSSPLVAAVASACCTNQLRGASRKDQQASDKPFTVDDTFSERDTWRAKQTRSANSPDPDAGTGSQLSRRVNELGSPFPATTKLPLSNELENPFIHQLRCLPTVKSTSKINVPQTTGEEVDKDKTSIGKHHGGRMYPEPNDLKRHIEAADSTPQKRQRVHTRTWAQPHKRSAHLRRYVQKPPSSDNAYSQPGVSPARSPEASAEEQDQRTSSEFPPHYQGMLGVLTSISKKLLTQVHDQEVAVSAFARTFSEGGIHLLGEVAMEHSREAKNSLQSFEKMKRSLKNSFTESGKQARGSSDKIQGMLNRLEVAGKGNEENTKHRLASIDDILAQSV